MIVAEELIQIKKRVERIPSLDTMVTLAKALGVRVADFSSTETRAPGR
jgi:hypothetical protein